MPTIDELPAVLAAADTDNFPVSQGGTLKRVSRAQVTAGLQPQLAISSGQILGRFSAGTGSPEALSLGAGLVMSGGKLAAVQIASDGGVPVESFGAKGDGITDDTDALTAALASGLPVLLGPHTYIVRGQWTIIQPNATLVGIPGLTVLKRLTQSGNGAWIAVQADGLRVDGVIFDANSSGVAQESWGVLVTSACANTDFHRCSFRNAQGATQGCGLVIQSAPLLAQHTIRDCEFSGNAAHGLWVQAAAGVLIANCRAHHNAGYGINVDFNDVLFTQQARLVQVLGNRAWSNARGIAVGNFNVTNTSPAIWGNANPDAMSIVVEANVCHDNTVYGLAVSGRALLVQGNLLQSNGSVANSGAGLLANVSASRVSQNMVVQSGLYGIDCGGSIDSDFAGNQVQGALIGINCGGGLNNRVDANTIRECSPWAITVNNVETDGHGANFGMACDNLALTGNWITIPAGASGIWLHDGPSRVLVARNSFTAAEPAACLRTDTDGCFVEANRFNQRSLFAVSAAIVSGVGTLVYPDIADGVTLTSAPLQGVQAMLSATQAANSGAISYVRVTNGGAGYTQAQVVFPTGLSDPSGPAGPAGVGGSGSGATAQAIISGGRLLGVFLLTPGINYGIPGSSVPVTITGDGLGATAVAYSGPPLAEERRLAVRSLVATRFSLGGSNPVQSNWSGADLLLPADAEVEWKAAGGAWHARQFPPTQWLATEGAGSTVLRSQNGGDVTLRPNAGGHLRLTSDTESLGVTSSIGRGTPESTVAAMPGSDYRNLDGGAGTTYWIKQQGTSSQGWKAIDGNAASIDGALSLVGHGSPQGLVAAPPGSDYRNLDGGSGQVFWVKQTGTGVVGWTPVGVQEAPIDGTFSVVGRGTPEGFIQAPPGSDYRNLDGGSGITFWIKQIGTGLYGWSPLA
jgi:hypothetical protein